VTELIIRALRGETSESEERRLADWAAASPSQERYLRDVARIWELSQSLDETDLVEVTPTIGDLLARRKSGVAPMFAPPTGGSRWLRRALQIAALLAIGFVASWVMQEAPAAAPSHAALTAAEFVTGDQERVTVRLTDGTVVRLGPGSRLRLAGTKEREVWLDGHAFFAVAKRDGQPFRVRTHAGNAVVLGTRFDFRAHQGELRIMVVEGKVELAARGRTVELHASEMAEAVSDGPLREQKVHPDFIQRELSWMGDFIVFEATPLLQAARELSAHYGVPVEVLDSTLAKETVYGWFVDESLENVLRIVCQAVNARCSMRPTGVTIEP
jgi:transmembrane sensor